MDDFIKWFLPKIEKFPRNYKFLFGDRLVEIQLDLLENLIEAYFQKEKLAHLRAANLGLEKLRHLLKICTELKISWPPGFFSGAGLFQLRRSRDPCRCDLAILWAGTAADADGSDEFVTRHERESTFDRRRAGELKDGVTTA